MSAIACMTCGAPLETYNRAYSGSWIAHRNAEDCIAVLRAERNHAEAVAFWRGVCIERARCMDSLADDHDEEAMVLETERRSGSALFRGAAGIWRGKAAQLRAWALAEVSR